MSLGRLGAERLRKREGGWEEEEGGLEGRREDGRDREMVEGRARGRWK